MEDTLCMGCQLRSAIARVTQKPFRLCHRCESQKRQAQKDWNAWGQTVARAPHHDDAVMPPKPAASMVTGTPRHGPVIPPAPARPVARPSFGSERPSSAVAWPSVVAPRSDGRKADRVKSAAVDWRD
jgi:hypothetical protein